MSPNYQNLKNIAFDLKYCTTFGTIMWKNIIGEFYG